MSMIIAGSLALCERHGISVHTNGCRKCYSEWMDSEGYGICICGNANCAGDCEPARVERYLAEGCHGTPEDCAACPMLRWARHQFPFCEEGFAVKLPTPTGEWVEGDYYEIVDGPESADIWP